MANSQTRQQLYDRIRESSKDEMILEEMIRLGFWAAEQEKPSVPADIIKHQGELQRELRELAAKQRMLDDPERAVKEMRKQRMKEARERRQETKAKHEQARYEKAQAWQERKKREILYLGSEVSTTKGDGVIVPISGLTTAQGDPITQEKAVCYPTSYRFCTTKRVGFLRSRPCQL